MLSSKTGLLSEFLYSVLRPCIMIRHILHGTQWTKIIRPSRGMGIVLSHAVFLAVFLPSAVKMTDNIDKTDKKASIDQGLKLLREATDLLSGSLSDNIPLVNSTSIPNADRSERIASNLRALFSAYDDSPGSTRRPAPQSQNQIAGPPKKKGRYASIFFFKPRETWTHEFLCLSYCRKELVPSKEMK